MRPFLPCLLLLPFVELHAVRTAQRYHDPRERLELYLLCGEPRWNNSSKRWATDHALGHHSSRIQKYKIKTTMIPTLLASSFETGSPRAMSVRPAIGPLSRPAQLRSRYYMVKKGHDRYLALRTLQGMVIARMQKMSLAILANRLSAVTCP